ncbi:ribosome recycling factor [Candidatus Dojkabacteria bacterium]|nr:ribosome recycling factor [Candidatus Dojkabacteria bacterium]
MILLSEAQTRLSGALDHLTKELAAIRTGRANPQIIEGMTVDAYGQKMPLNQVANINVVDAGLLTVNVWDKTLINEVEKTLKTSEMGFGVSVDGDLVRVSFPPLSEERRTEYVKVMKDKLEDSRIAVRVIRKEVLDWIDEQGFSEDEKKGKEKELQTMIDSVNSEIEETGKKKETELMTV